MAKRSNQKLKLLYLSKIFLEKTDEEHKLTLAQILIELERYGIYAERKSIYDDMEALRVFGLNVCSSRDRCVRYYISQSAVDIADVKIIYDLLLTSSMFNEMRVNELVKKFSQNAATLGEVKKISGELALQEGAYKEAEYKNLLSICKAISNDKKIKFKYFEWNSHKQRMLMFNGELITVDPIAAKYENGKYVMYAVNSATKNAETFIVDRMVNTAVLNRGRELPDAGADIVNEDIRENLRLRCDNSLAGDLFDKFGIGVTILANRDDYFEVAFKTKTDDDFYSWIFSQQGKVKILSPDSAQKKYKEMLEENLKKVDLI